MRSVPIRAGQVMLVALLLLARPAAAGSPPTRAKPSAAVRALLNRSAKEPTAAAAKTLDRAGRLAEQAHDRAGALAVADRERRLGSWAMDRVMT